MDKILEMLKALADRNRLRVVAALMDREELCACQITEFLQVTGATASRHMGLLLRAGIVQSRKEGRWTYYRLAPSTDTGAVFQWLESSFAESDQLQADLQALERIVEIGREDLCRMQRGEACCPK